MIISLSRPTPYHLNLSRLIVDTRLYLGCTPPPNPLPAVAEILTVSVLGSLRFQHPLTVSGVRFLLSKRSDIWSNQTLIKCRFCFNTISLQGVCLTLKSSSSWRFWSRTCRSEDKIIIVVVLSFAKRREQIKKLRVLICFLINNPHLVFKLKICQQNNPVSWCSFVRRKRKLFNGLSKE